VRRKAGRIAVPQQAPTYLRSRKWWQTHEDAFIAALSGRALAIKAGLEPGPAEDLIEKFYHGKYTPFRMPYASRWADKVVMRMIREADALARGEQDDESATDDRSPSDG
jgi:hypothetical protein